MTDRYAIGVDFGTLSARAVLVEVGSGRELASASLAYPHAVMDRKLPDGTKLGVDWALQHPQDYVDALGQTIRQVLKETGIAASKVIGVSTDFTACTILPIDKDGTPLCLLEKWKGHPHAYVKLWKHHAAQAQANRLNEVAEARGEAFLARYGGKISSEWMIPKIMQVLEEAPEVYEAADAFVEAADWIIWCLTGRIARNACTAGYKAIWHKKEGYPSKAFFKALDPRLENVVEEKLKGDIYPIGAKAGEVTPAAWELTGLRVGTAVAVGNVDAHVSLPAAGLVKSGQMLMIMGTSTCHILNGAQERLVPGMCGVVEDGVLPGLMGYEAGQSCVGDHFEWFVQNCLPASYWIEGQSAGRDMHELMTAKAAALKPGESGLVALDWWNGNRSVLVDVDLTGLMVGMTLQTKPEEMYRALIEATAFGTRMIIETFEANGVPVTELYAAGGIAKKNALMMQIYADVTHREIRVARSSQAPALGSALFGALAAGKAAGGYDDIVEAAAEMGGVLDVVYRPCLESVKVYDALYEQYKALHDLFGRGGSEAMKRLKAIKAAARG